MGRALARQMATRGDRLVLLGRKATQLASSAADLRTRGAPLVEHCHCDLAEPGTFESALRKADELLDPIHTVVVSAAMFASQETLEADGGLAHTLATVNFSNTLAFCEVARKLLIRHGGGTLCVFSSVAGDRGRKPVVIYGATKAGLSHYLESLDLRYRAEGLKVVCVKPGFVRTSMTAGLKSPPFAGEPGPVAARVLKAIDRGDPVVYAPPIWAAVMGVIRRLPRAVMRRVAF